MFHHADLEIHQREIEGVLILDLSGKLEMGRGDIALRDFVETLLGQGNRKLLLDMAKVLAIDTSGSGVLLILAQEYRAAGGRMGLFHVDRGHAKIYEMARLESVLEVYPDEIDAVNSFFPGRTTAHYDILNYVESQHHEDPGKEK